MTDGPAHRESAQTRVDHAVEEIARRISHGDYVPGQRLTEAELTSDLGLGRGSLREAMRRLAADGLLEIEPYRGAVVTRWSISDIRNIFEVREALEGLAAQLAARRIGESDNLVRMREMRAEIEAIGADCDVEQFIAHNQRFHGLVREIAGNQQLLRQLAQLQFPAYRLVYFNLVDPDGRRRSLQEHFAIAEAIMDGDGSAADHLTRRHVRRTAQNLETMTEETAEFYGGDSVAGPPESVKSATARTNPDW